MLSADELARMRSEAEEFLVEEVDLYRASESVSATGGKAQVVPGTPTREKVKARVSTPPGQAGIVEGREWETFEMAFKAEDDIKEGDLIERDGKRFQVVQVSAGQTWEVLRRVVVNEVAG
jgi:hypothetical protein